MTVDIGRQSAAVARIATDLQVSLQTAYVVTNTQKLAVSLQVAYVAIFPGTRLSVSEQSVFVPIFSNIPLGGVKRKRIVNIMMG